MSCLPIVGHARTQYGKSTDTSARGKYGRVHRLQPRTSHCLVHDWPQTYVTVRSTGEDVFYGVGERTGPAVRQLARNPQLTQ